MYCRKQSLLALSFLVATACGDDVSSSGTENATSTTGTSGEDSTADSGTTGTSSTTNASSSTASTGSSTTAPETSTSTDGTSSTGGTSSSGSDGSSSSEGSESTGTTVVCGDGMLDDNGVCFGDGVAHAAAGSPVAIALGDFNGDDDIDVVTANFADDSVSLLAGDGAGGMLAAVVTPLGADAEPITLSAGLLSPDDVSDVLVANSGLGSVSILEGGEAGFTITSIDTGGTPGDVAIVDFNDDGAMDFAVVNTEDDVFGTWVANGGGGYLLTDVNDGGPIPPIDTFVFGNVAIGDTLDVVFSGDLVIGASPGIGDGEFQETVVVVAEVGGPVARMRGGDINDDGELDIVVSTTVGVTLLLGDGDPLLPEFDEIPLGSHGNVVDAVFADVTGEGNLDIVLVARGDAELVIYPGHGDGSVGAPTTISISAGATGVAAASIDGDGVKDIVVSDDVDGSITVFTSNP